MYTNIHPGNTVFASSLKLVVAEKASVAQSIASVLGATQRKDGYMEGNGYIVSWCVIEDLR